MKAVNPRRREWGTAALLVMCVAVVGFWECMSNRSRQPFKPFAVSADDFLGFAPEAPWLVVRRLAVNRTAIEPNVLAFGVREGVQGSKLSAELGKVQPLMVRLVHGYNLADCMRIRGYRVDLIEDIRNTAAARVPQGGRRVQVWRLTSDIGDRSIWVSSMVRAADGQAADADARDMPFPRIGTPDDPNWVPQGLTLASLRHPFRNLGMFIRARWNSSRCDLATFLKLRQPSWASDELLTLVTASYAVIVGPEEEEAIRQLMAVHVFFLDQLRQWGAARASARPE